MCNYEKLLIDADNYGLEIVEKVFKSDAKGLCKGKKIGIKKTMTEAEKTCVLAEELGHYHTSVGNILDQSKLNNQKQEKVARKWAVNRLVTPDDLIRACKEGYEYLPDIADYLGITTDFLTEAIEVFKRMYGVNCTVGNYTIRFNDIGFSVI